MSDRDWAIDQALQNEEDFRDPRTQTGLPDNILIFLPPIPKMGASTLPPPIVRKRLTAVQESIDRAREAMPFAAGQMQHWLSGSGKIRILGLSDLNVYDPDLKITDSIVKEHMEKFRKGMIDRFRADHDRHIKVGQTRKLYYQSQIEWETPGPDALIRPTSSDIKKVDTYLGVGVTQVVSELTIHRADKGQCADVLSWRFQLYDIYNWEEGKAAPIPIPTKLVPQIPLPREAYNLTTTKFLPVSFIEVKDDWFVDLENASDARWFEAVSEIYAIRATNKIQRVCSK